MTTLTTHFDLVSSLLLEKGFKKRTSGIFTLELRPDVLGWLGLNRATRHRAPREVEINPVVGVRFQTIERAVAEFSGRKFHPYQPPTVSSPLGYLMPENRYIGWEFTSTQPERVAADMVDAIALHGVAFMRSAVDIAELRRRLSDGLGFEEQLMYRRPVAALVAGSVADARALLDQALVRIGGRTDAAAVDFRKPCRSPSCRAQR